MRDFTKRAYRRLLRAAQEAGYDLIALRDYLASPESTARRLILRQDVDRAPQNALAFAELQADLGGRGTYYFRAVPQSWDDKIIRRISTLGHEIGYHYEDLTLCNGAVPAAIEHFSKKLGQLRELAPVTTICMHGSPLSRWDNRTIWAHADYRTFGIQAEPYFDLDFSNMLYLTDTGWRWDGDSVSVRDRVYTEQTHDLASTWDIIAAFDRDALPHSILLTTHPQRWSDGPLPWLAELVSQRSKNQVKRLLAKRQRATLARPSGAHVPRLVDREPGEPGEPQKGRTRE